MEIVSQRRLRDDSGDILRRAAAGDEPLRLTTRHGLGCAGAERILRRVRLLTVDDAVLRRAGRPSLPGGSVRTADAVHLVTAVRLQQSTFLTDDRVQVRAAELLGLVVQSPGLDNGGCRS